MKLNGNSTTETTKHLEKWKCLETGRQDVFWFMKVPVFKAIYGRNMGELVAWEVIP